MMTAAQSQALAAFIARVRPDWDHPGIVAAIGKASGLGSPFDVARALVNLAENRDLTSPGMLHQPGKHWRKADNEPAGPSATHNVHCHRHPLSVMPNCPQCRAEDEPAPPTAEYFAEKKKLEARRPIPTVEKRLADFMPPTTTDPEGTP